MGFEKEGIKIVVWGGKEDGEIGKRAWQEFSMEGLKERYQANQISPEELFPPEKAWQSWEGKKRQQWQNELLEVLSVSLETLQAQGPEGFFNFWGPRADGKVGWLFGQWKPLEDTDLPYHQMYPGIPQADYQYGGCPGCKIW